VGRVSPATTVEFRQGALLDSPVQDTIDRYTGTARDSEVTIAVLGISNLIEGEEGAAIASKHRGDRPDLGLPASQLELLKALRKAARKLVVVLMGGSPIATPEIHDLADAVLFVWYPGEEGGRAIADVIFGDASPSGRLPITFPRSADQLPPFADYSMKGRTYRYMTEEPLYPFGFGLGYASFGYGPLELGKMQLKPGESTTARVTLTNTGAVAGDEIAQLYVSVLSAPVRVPIASLRGMQRVGLRPGESKAVEFAVDPAMLAYVDETGREQTRTGQFRLTIAGAFPSARSAALGAAAPAQAVLTVR
jgi:beta-glucosidase